MFIDKIPFYTYNKHITHISNKFNDFLIVFHNNK